MATDRPQTLAVHAGATLAPSRARPVAPPLELSAVSDFEDAQDLDRALEGADFVYGRNRAAAAERLELAVAALEGAQTCLAYASGMAALRAALDAQPLSPGDTVVIAADGYGATRALAKQWAQRHQLNLVPLLLARPDAPAQLQGLKPKLVLAESMTNPLLSVPDLPELAAACRRIRATLVVDGTFASPALQRTLAQGADLAVQSTTKWLNGHSDALGGTVSGTQARLAPLRAARVLEGPLLGPFEAWITLRGVRTLPVRMQAHCAHALAVAERLARDPRLSHVIYPGLTSHPDHAVAARLFQGGFGGMLAFEIANAGRQQVFRFLESVELCRPAPSLGDVATLVMHPATASARRMTPDERAAAGIGENLVRVSVGLEHPDDIADDLLQAVGRALEATP